MHVRQVDEADLDGDGSAMVYNSDTLESVIKLNKKCSLTRRRYLLIHELQHVVNDCMHVALQDHERHFKP